MLFSLCIEKKQATDRITYELWAHKSSNNNIHSYSIKKRDNLSNEVVYTIARSIKSKQAIYLIWNDILTGIQK